MKRIIIFAANSFLGKELVSHFLKMNYEVIVVTRKTSEVFPGVLAHEIWDGKNLGTWKDWFEKVDCIINLAGKSVNCRYTKKNKAAIYASRLESTAVIQEALNLRKNQTEICWMNAASATIYAHEEQKPHTELKGTIGTGFSVDVCQKWEGKFFEQANAEIRKIALRTSIVLGNSGGVLPVLVGLAKRGLGGKMGSGEQRFSWISSEDFCRAIQFIFENKTCEGIYNLASPNAVKNSTLQASIRNAYQINWYINQPKWLLKFGAILLGTETELVLKSRYVYPERLLKDGFQFKIASLEKLFDEKI